VGVDLFPAEVARIALIAAADHGFALAGGNALVAHGLVDRPTQDVDLFSPEPGAPAAVSSPPNPLSDATSGRCCSTWPATGGSYRR
jgi:hypothetical protein